MCPSEALCMCLHPVPCPSVCPGKLTALDYLFRFPCLWTSGWVQFTFTSHQQQMWGRETEEARALFPLCPVIVGQLCPCTENPSQQPSPLATDCSPGPFRPRGGNSSVSLSLTFPLTLPTSANIPFIQLFPIPWLGRAIFFLLGPWLMHTHSILSTTPRGR